MKLIKNAEFGGERPLFESHDLRLENVIIRTGESAIKECSNIETVDCRFEGNYPFWHVHGFKIDRCYFDVGGRSALWYSDHLKMTDTIIDAPKMFREMDEIDIENVTMNDADEVFWRCNGIRIKNLKLHGGTYPFMFSNNIYVDGLESNSKYVFQYVKNVEIHHAKITTKDAFWEVENVTISTIPNSTANTSAGIRRIYVWSTATLPVSNRFAMHTTLFLKTVPSDLTATVPLSTARCKPIFTELLQISRTRCRDALWLTNSVP